MPRRIAILGLLLLLVACGGGAWLVFSRVSTAFIAPGAANVHISELRPGERLITYTMPNPDDGWQTAVGQRLNLSGWNLETDPHQWGGTETITTLASYVRISHMWLFSIRERAEFFGDRSSAQIKVTYTLIQQP